MSRPKVCLAMPHYGEITVGAARGFYQEVNYCRHCDIITMADVGSSLLPDTFNKLFALALGARDKGVRVPIAPGETSLEYATHFAMIHSDIRPAHGWLDLLWGAMKTHGADLISAIVPIKDHTGRTSTAIGSVSDPWAPPRYIGLRDRRETPETFAIGDISSGPDDVLLVNTGLFLADLRRPWWNPKVFAFHFVPRIVQDPESGDYASQIRPEDWEMSRHLHAAGARVMATWAVPLEHLGTFGLGNQPPSTPKGA